MDKELPEMWEDPRSPEAQEPAPAQTQPAKPEQAMTVTQKAKLDLRKLEPQIQAMLPEGFPIAKFTQVALTAVLSNRDILAADRDSLLGACLKAAQDGLLPDGKEAALVVFRTKAGPKVQYMPMVWGITKKMHQTGEVGTLNSQVVFEKDEFSFWVDEKGEHMLHKPKMFGERGGPVGVYASIITKDGFPYIEVMSKEEIHAVRDVSKAKDYGPWASDFASEMWRKTCIRRLSKRVPMTAEIERIIRREDELFDFGRTDRTKAGLAGELNGEGQEQADQAGDKIESLRDLQKPGDGPLPREDLGGNPGGRSMEHGADVQEASRRTAPPRVEVVSGKARGNAVAARGTRVGTRGNRRDPESDAPSMAGNPGSPTDQ